MTYTYGPVASWRYGRSLGVDVTLPPKKCTFNCSYCQLGPTKRHVSGLEAVQDEMPASDIVLEEIELTLDRLRMDSIDVVTFSGAGEPTLNLNIGGIAKGVRNLVGEKPIVLLTNASLLPDPRIRSNLWEFDIVTAKLDAGDEDTFQQINRPAKGTFNLPEIVDGIKSLHRQMQGLLALEVMLQKGPRGVSNIEGIPRRMLLQRIVEVSPDVVQIYTPWRPTAVSTVKPVSREALLDFSREIGAELGMERVWTYGVHDARGESVSWRYHEGREAEILGMLERRPCRAIDIAATLGITASSAIRLLRPLLEGERIIKVAVDGEFFFEVAK